MAAKKSAAAKDAATAKSARTRKERKFPALIFEEALKLPQAIQDHASGQKVRPATKTQISLTLFEKLDQAPDSLAARRLITASG